MIYLVTFITVLFTELYDEKKEIKEILSYTLIKKMKCYNIM